jgi:peptide/nickel transport system substrate-binding protein
VARALRAALAAALLVAVPGAGAATDAETPRRGGTVVLAGTPREPACLNAFFTRCQQRNLPLMVMGMVLPGAYSLGPDLTLRPNLVSHVDRTTEPPFTLTYHIRPEARWSDGTPVSSRDFVFTYRTSLSKGVELFSSYAEALARVADVRALDARTVRVVLRSRFGGWRLLFPHVLPEHALAGADFSTVWNERIHDPRTGRPIGSGPFLVGRWARGREITFVRNPRYWGARPAYLDRLVFRFWREHEETIEWLRRNELDVVHGLPFSAGQARELRQLPGVEVRTSPSEHWEHLALRVQAPGHPALRNPLVRRAIAHAIDKTALVRALFGERDRRDLISESAFFATSSRYYRPNWRIYRYDPAASTRLLRQAGCRLGADGIYLCAGEQLSLRAYTLSGVAFREQSLRIIQKQLRDVGVELDLRYVPSGPFFASLLPSGDFDLAHHSWGREPEVSNSTILRCGGSQNRTGYCQRLVDRDIDEAGRILDPEQYIRALHRLDARVALDVPLIPLYHRPLIGAARSAVRGYTSREPVDQPFLGAENWWLAL